MLIFINIFIILICKINFFILEEIIMNYLKIFFILFFITVGNSVFAKEESSELVMPSRADSHAPISIMGDHIHKAGEVMF